MLFLATDGGEMPRWAIFLRLYGLPKPLLTFLQKRTLGMCRHCDTGEIRLLYVTPTQRSDDGPCSYRLCRKHAEEYTENMNAQWAEENQRQLTNSRM